MEEQDQQRELRLETSMSLDQAVAYLGDLLSGMRAGRICLQREGAEDALELSPRKTVSFELKARQKASKESVTIKLSWRNEPVAPENGPGLRISSAAHE